MRETRTEPIYPVCDENVPQLLHLPSLVACLLASFLTPFFHSFHPSFPPSFYSSRSFILFSSFYSILLLSFHSPSFISLFVTLGMRLVLILIDTTTALPPPSCSRVLPSLSMPDNCSILPHKSRRRTIAVC